MIASDALLAAVDRLTSAAFSPPLQPSRRSEVASVAPTRDSHHQMVRKTQPDEDEKKPTGIMASPPLRRFFLSAAVISFAGKPAPPRRGPNIRKRKKVGYEDFEMKAKVIAMKDFKCQR
nr:hypothetical protein Iba_chr11dCG10000 [Ipomoea batatas]